MFAVTVINELTAVSVGCRKDNPSVRVHATATVPRYLREFFSRSSHTSDLKVGTGVAVPRLV